MPMLRCSEAALKAYLSVTDLGPDPTIQTKESGSPVGLKVRQPWLSVVSELTPFRISGPPATQMRIFR
jgi:hypothetical protein